VSLPGKDDFDNVGLRDERYRYDIDFRSTSNVPLDEFVVDDPLEAVSAGQIILEELWTPVTWGDVDGRVYVLYKTNKTSDSAVYTDATGSSEKLSDRQYSNKGYKLWAGISWTGDSRSGGLDATARNHLYVSKLGLAADEYVTAVRFDYGAVEVGFTSRNKAHTSQNGEWRDNGGNIFLPSPEDAAKIAPLGAKPSLFAKFKGWISGDAAAYADSSGQMAPLATGISGNVVDWTPALERADYAAGAAGASGLAPASYLVSASKAMDSENIVTSVSASAARGADTDQDRDAVITRLITTFDVKPGEFDIEGSISEDSFIEKAARSGVVLKGGKWYDTKTGRIINLKSPKTGDDMMLGLWIGIALLAGLVLVRLLFRRQQAKGGARI
jgi:LPXTG-motif cell wall-anchored protein